MVIETNWDASTGQFAANFRDKNSAGDSNAGPGLQFLQINLRYCHFGYTLLQQFLRTKSVDVILIQDPPKAILSGEGFFPGYNVNLPTTFDPDDHANRPLVAILIRSSLHFQPLPSPSQRVCGVLVSTRHGPVAFISAYIRHSDGDGLGTLVDFVTATRPRTP